MDALARVAHGEIGALGELYDRHARALLGFARRCTSPHDAEDIVQTTFIRAARGAAAFTSTNGSVRSWLFGIAAHVVRERRRSLARLARALLRSDVGPLASGTSWRDDERDDLRRGLHRLTEPKRIVLLLVEVEGFTCVEVATMLDVPVGTVWTRLHHARREMRVFLEEADR